MESVNCISYNDTCFIANVLQMSNGKPCRWDNVNSSLVLICASTVVSPYLLFRNLRFLGASRKWNLVLSLTLSQCTLATLECHWLTQWTLGYHLATQRIPAGYIGTPLEKLSWNSPTLECHWRNLVESAPHWDATGEILTFAVYTGSPLEGLWQPTQAPTHIVKDAE